MSQVSNKKSRKTETKKEKYNRKLKEEWEQTVWAMKNEKKLVQEALDRSMADTEDPRINNFGDITLRPPWDYGPLFSK